MVEKRIFDGVLSRIKVGPVKVTYPDGESKKYGSGKAELHLKIKSVKALRAMYRNLSLGFGESYMDKLIDIDGPLDQVMALLVRNQSAFKVLALNNMVGIKNLNVRSRQQSQIQRHYDLGNDFYKLWLDKSMTYSCAYFKTPTDTLEKAQSQKVEHLLKKLQLEPGMHILDIGCGWGTLLIRAVQEHGVTGHGITLSQQQLEHCQAEVKRLGLEKKLRFELANYQDLADRGMTFDRIISVGMYEHVGRRNQKVYFQAVSKMLKDGGVSVLHTISNQSNFGGTDAWMDKYIFPGGYIPALGQVAEQVAKHNFHLVDYENLRIHYAMTLSEWWRRYEKNQEKIIKDYGDRFYRMWRLYLASCASAFRYGHLELSQFVFTKGINNDLPLTREHLYK